MNVMKPAPRFLVPQVRTIEVPQIELVFALGAAIDLLDPILGAHQRRVAIIAANLAKELGLADSEVARVMQAGLLHSVGALGHRNGQDHSATSARFLEISPLTRRLAPLVACYREPLARLRDYGTLRAADALLSQVLNLADFIDDSIDPAVFILSQVAARRADATTHANANLDPSLADAFLRASEADSFWLDASSVDLDARIRMRLAGESGAIADLDALQDFGRLYSVLVDARSPFTATHSWGVASVASLLATKSGFGTVSAMQIEIAAQLHDIGKLAVPSEIVEKPAGLTAAEFGSVRSHAYHTGTLLERIPGMSQIADWARAHHEKLDGTGYPQRRQAGDIPTQARIIAVADRFVALTEDRPYRAGMPSARALVLLQADAEHGVIDQSIVNTLNVNFDTIDAIRRHAQDEERCEMKSFLRKAH
jgi:HD-GYP domain-containing protein (c-di-GMP phosphodiesterase class II)